MLNLSPVFLFKHLKFAVFFLNIRIFEKQKMFYFFSSCCDSILQSGNNDIFVYFYFRKMVDILEPANVDKDIFEVKDKVEKYRYLWNLFQEFENFAFNEAMSSFSQHVAEWKRRWVQYYKKKHYFLIKRRV